MPSNFLPYQEIWEACEVEIVHLPPHLSPCFNALFFMAWFITHLVSRAQIPSFARIVFLTENMIFHRFQFLIAQQFIQLITQTFHNRGSRHILEFIVMAINFLK
jgi:cytochrome c oxidase assembly factor CtaG